MKKIFLSLAFIFIVGNGLTIAQDNIVSVEPIRLWSGLRLKYERVLTERFSVGSQATIYYGSTPGFQIAPLAKYYFKANAPEGFYALAKLPLGLFSYKYESVDSKLGNKDKSNTFFNAGLGVGVGWQMIFGKQDNWSVDFNMGVKLVGHVPKPKDSYLDDSEFALNNASWYLAGAGSIFDCLLTFGYRF